MSVDEATSSRGTAGSDDAPWRERLAALLEDLRSRPRPGTSQERAAAAVAWQSELVDAGLAAPGWPRWAGGMELDLADQLDYYRMTVAAGAPRHPCNMSFIVAPTLIVHGTAEQQQRYLEPLLRADEFWCQGFSETGAGSDLASLSTRAVRDGDVYRVTGQKIWTTKASRADFMFALVRTGPAGRGTSGITYLLIPMDATGVEVRPLKDAAGGHHFAEVFFDDVEVPVSARVGEEGGGWSIMRTSLGHERATAFLADEFRYRSTVDKVTRLVADQGYDRDPLVRAEVAGVETGVQIIANNSARALDAVLRGDDPGGVASVNRLVKSEFEQRMHRLALRVTGPGAVLGNRSPGAVDGGRWTFGYLMSRAATIGAGTSEIQRNTIAETVLGLPSHRGEGRRPAVVPPGRPLAPSDDDEAAVRETVGQIVDGSVSTPALVHDEVDRDALWADLTAFGVVGLSAAEDAGGEGASPRLTAAAIEEAAHRLAPAPLVPAVAALALLEAIGADGLARTVIAGARAAVAAAVSDEGWAVCDRSPVLSGDRVTGTVERVVGAPDATVFLVVARDGSTGETVVLSVDRDDVELSDQEPLDQTSSVSCVGLVASPSRVLGRGAEADRALVIGRRRAHLALAADSVGVATRAVAIATEWASEREQFGRVIGSFQAVSHRCTDMLVAAESARNLVLAACEVGPVDDAVDIVIDLAVAQALSTAVTVAEDCIQVLGGIGFTWEHPAHLLLRRAVANEATFARPEALRDRVAGALLGR